MKDKLTQINLEVNLEQMKADCIAQEKSALEALLLPDILAIVAEDEGLTLEQAKASIIKESQERLAALEKMDWGKDSK